jgi:hypothetical protein
MIAIKLAMEKALELSEKIRMVSSRLSPRSMAI